MAQPVLPHHGARFQIDRLTTSDTSAQYQVKVFVEEGCYHREVTLSTESQEVQWVDRADAEEPAQPMAPWIKKHAESLMRSLRQGASRDGVWGRRIRRWKEAPSKPS